MFVLWVAGGLWTWHEGEEFIVTLVCFAVAVGFAQTENIIKEIKELKND